MGICCFCLTSKNLPLFFWYQHLIFSSVEPFLSHSWSLWDNLVLRIHIWPRTGHSWIPTPWPWWSFREGYHTRQPMTVHLGAFVETDGKVKLSFPLDLKIEWLGTTMFGRLAWKWRESKGKNLRDQERPGPEYIISARGSRYAWNKT